MEVFISWSGERSKAVATALHGWIPRVIQRMEPWLSLEDIEKGARWHTEIAVHLEKSRVGISCLTPENLEAPWLLFEAGAISKQLDKPYVCTYLFDLRFADLRDPWAQFHGTLAERDDTLKLMRTINAALGDVALKDNDLVVAFERWWQDLDAALRKVPEPKGEQRPQRDAREILEEILALVREQSRSIADVSVAVSGPMAGLHSFMVGPGSEVGGGTLGSPYRDLLRTIVNEPTPEGDLVRALERYGESEPIAKALGRLTKALQRRKKSQQEGADIQRSSPGEGGEAAT